ncbi:MAG: hypothetical protein B0A82_08285 [Alkalinema sp. CACIAM 70d]|nr:MAG: hypothetical protein B0A82_08285 [Alkalinema sp. CACIAM 70d]
MVLWVEYDALSLSAQKDGTATHCFLPGMERVDGAIQITDMLGRLLLTLLPADRLTTPTIFTAMVRIRMALLGELFSMPVLIIELSEFLVTGVRYGH